MLKVQCGGLGSSCTRFSFTTGYNSRPSILKAYSCVAIQGWYRCPQAVFTFRNNIKGVLVEKYKSEVFLDQNRHHSNSSSSHFQSLKHQSSYQHLSIITHSSLLHFHFHFHSHLSSSNSNSTNTSTIKMQPQTLASIIAFLCAVSSAAPVTGKPIPKHPFREQEPPLTKTLFRLNL